MKKLKLLKILKAIRKSWKRLSFSHRRLSFSLKKQAFISYFLCFAHAIKEFGFS